MTNTELDILAEKLAAHLAGELHVSRWLTVKEACEYAKIKRDTLMKWVNEGYIYGNKRSGKWIIDRDSIDSYYNSERLTAWE